MNTENTPFSSLTPDIILNSLDHVGLFTNGRLLALNSYENRVYQIGVEDGPPVIAKFYRPGRWTDAEILEEHEFLLALHQQEIPVVPPLAFDAGKTLLQQYDFRFAVFPKQGGRAPELAGSDMLQWMGRFIGRIHAVGALQPFQHRPTLDIVSFGEEPRRFLLSQGFIPPELEQAYRSVAEHALEGVARCFERAGKICHIRLHGDCYPGNILWTDDGPHFVDFDDSRMGVAMQDLWMLISGNRDEMSRQLGQLLAGYQTFYDFDHNQLHLIEALRTLRLIHYSAWLARRWHDPAFPLAFPWFNTPRYWQDRILDLREQIALMQEEPLHII